MQKSPLTFDVEVVLALQAVLMEEDEAAPNAGSARPERLFLVPATRTGSHDAVLLSPVVVLKGGLLNRAGDTHGRSPWLSGQFNCSG